VTNQQILAYRLESAVGYSSSDIQYRPQLTAAVTYLVNRKGVVALVSVRWPS
jgi:hypothetical protein